jgi:hypothetical protein
MLKSLIIIIPVGVLSYTFTDVETQSLLQSVVLPIAVLMSIISAVIWLVLLFSMIGVDENRGIQKIENNAPISPDDFGEMGGGGDGGG